MPFYTFTCEECSKSELLILPVRDFEKPRKCECGGVAVRDYNADMPTVQFSGHRVDHNRIKDPKARVQGAASAKAARRKERAYGEHISERRKQLANDRNRNSGFKHTHSIPAELYHGKVRETGDKSYWNDPKNVAKHSDFKVS
jgi:predicted nucleic acid-binding Zn ribbon protein